MTKFARSLALLVVVVILLVAGAKFLGTGTATAAPAKSVQYRVVRVGEVPSPQKLEETLNLHASAGWQLDAVITPMPGSGGYSQLVFRK
jgi:hypothetical protein